MEPRHAFHCAAAERRNPKLVVSNTCRLKAGSRQQILD